MGALAVRVSVKLPCALTAVPVLRSNKLFRASVRHTNGT